MEYFNLSILKSPPGSRVFVNVLPTFGDMNELRFLGSF